MSKHIRHFYLSKVFFSFLFCALMTLVQAQVWTGDIDTDWTNPSNWGGGTLPTSGSTVTIPAAPSGGNFPIYGGSPIIDFTIFNAGLITFNSFTYNTGSIINFDVGQLVSNNFFVNAGQVVFDNDGNFDNNGIFENFGSFDNAASAIFSNNTNAVYTNHGTFNNFGTINNNGSWINLGNLSSTNNFDNNSSLMNKGLFNNTFGSTFSNNSGGSVQNFGGATFLSNGSLNNAASFNNAGEVIFNSGAVVTNTATIDNQNLLNNSGQLVNNGTLNNNGSIRNNEAARIENNTTFQNLGIFDNLACAILVQNAFNTITGEVINNGLIYEINGSVVITGGEFGFVFNDLSQTPPPVPGCKPNVVVTLDATGFVEVTPDDIDKGAYGNCGAMITNRTITPNIFGTDDIGQQLVTLEVTDEFNLSSSCDAVITVAAFVPPITPIDDPDIDLTCPENITITTQPGSNSAVVNWTEPSGTSNCDDGGGGPLDCSSIPNNINGFVFMGEHNGSKYFCSEYNATWSSANAAAIAAGGHLAVINDAAENEFIRSHIMAGHAWIGLTDQASEGSFKWVTGEALSYSNWDVGQPNNYNGNEDHVRILQSNGKWTDKNGGISLEYVMEIPCGSTQASVGNCDYIIKSKLSGKVLDVHSASLSNGANVIQWTENAAANQIWAVEKTAPKQFLIHPKHSGKCLDAYGYNNGANADQWGCGYNSQYWDFIPNGDGYFRIKNTHNGLYLNVQGGSTANGANINVYQWFGGNGQLWELIPVGDCDDGSNNGGGNNAELVIEQIEGPTNGSEFFAGTTQVAYRATDDCGNEEICVFEVTIETTPSNIVPNCPADIVVDAAPGADEAVITWANPSATTDCFSSNVVTVGLLDSTFLSGDKFPIGTTSITYSFQDDCGSFTTCSFDVTVNFVAASLSLLSCPQDIITSENPVSWAEPTASTTCFESSINIVQTEGPVNGSPFPTGTTRVSYLISDNCGNVDICTFLVITDGEPPVAQINLSCEANINATAPNGSNGIAVNWSEPIASTTCTENQGIVDIVQTAGPANGSVLPIGLTTISYEVTDACGNIETCSFDITVTEDSSPTTLSLFCPGDQTGRALVGETSTIVTWTEPTASTTCPTANVSITQTSGLANGSEFPLGTSTVTYEATDDCGNIETCTFKIMVTNEECDISSIVSNIVCNGSTFTFDLVVTGVGNPWGWTGGGQTVAYDVLTTFGPYNISDGIVSFTVTDTDNPTCTDIVSVDPSVECSGGTACNTDVLFVVGSSALTTADAAAKARMEALGFTVIIADDDVVQTTNGTDKGLIVISASISANKVGAKFRDIAVPVVSWEAWGFDDMKMTGSGHGINYGKQSAQNELTIVDDTHPIASGLTATVTILTAAKAINWSRPNNAAMIASLSADLSKSMIFAYEVGDDMVGLKAPAKRVGMFMRSSTMNYFNNQAWQLFDAAILWAADCPQTQQLVSNTNNQIEAIANDSATKESTLNQEEEVQDRTETNELKDTDFRVFPNPATDLVYVDLQSFIGKTVELFLFDQTGRIVVQNHINELLSPTHVIQLDDLQAGVYYIKLLSDQQQWTKPVVVVK